MPPPHQPLHLNHKVHFYFNQGCVHNEPLNSCQCAHSTESASMCPLPGGAVSAGSDLLTADRLLLHRLSHSVPTCPSPPVSTTLTTCGALPLWGRALWWHTESLQEVGTWSPIFVSLTSFTSFSYWSCRTDGLFWSHKSFNDP